MKACGPLVLYQFDVEIKGKAPVVIPIIPRKNPFVLKDKKRIVNYNYAYGDVANLLPEIGLAALAVFAGGSFGNYLARPNYN